MNYKIHIISICIIICLLPYKVYSLQYNNVPSPHEDDISKNGSFFSPGKIIADESFFSLEKKQQVVATKTKTAADPKKASIVSGNGEPTFFSSSLSATIQAMQFVNPVAGIITRRFAYRVHPKTRIKIYYHRGIDISAVRGTPIQAAYEGTVVTSCYNRRGYGHLVIIKHPHNVYTYYGHLYKRYVKPGQEIKKGEIIGAVGSTGRSTGPHLHFELRIKDTPINPSLMIDFQ